VENERESQPTGRAYIQRSSRPLNEFKGRGWTPRNWGWIVKTIREGGKGEQWEKEGRGKRKESQ